jgi:hypothetical protein
VRKTGLRCRPVYCSILSLDEVLQKTLYGTVYSSLRTLLAGAERLVALPGLQPCRATIFLLARYQERIGNDSALSFIQRERLMIVLLGFWINGYSLHR